MAVWCDTMRHMHMATKSEAKAFTHLESVWVFLLSSHFLFCAKQCVGQLICFGPEHRRGRENGATPKWMNEWMNQAKKLANETSRRTVENKHSLRLWDMQHSRQQKDCGGKRDGKNIISAITFQVRRCCANGILYGKLSWDMWTGKRDQRVGEWKNKWGKIYRKILDKKGR